MLLVDLHHLALQPVRLGLVALLRLLDERRHRLHPDARLHRLLVQRPEQRAHHDAEDHEHPSVCEAQAVVHPDQDVHDERRDRLDDRSQKSAVGVRVVQIVPQVREPAVFQRPHIQPVAEVPRRRHGERERERHPRLGARTAAQQGRRRHFHRAAHGDASAELRRVLFGRERRKEEVLRLDARPLERAVEELHASGLEGLERRALRPARLGHHAEVVEVVHRVGLDRA